MKLSNVIFSLIIIPAQKTKKSNTNIVKVRLFLAESEGHISTIVAMAKPNQRTETKSHFSNTKRTSQLMSFSCWRRARDSNPRGLAPKRFSRPPRYDHFDMPPYCARYDNTASGLCQPRQSASGFSGKNPPKYQQNMNKIHFFSQFPLTNQ